MTQELESFTRLVDDDKEVGLLIIQFMIKDIHQTDIELIVLINVSAIIKWASPLG